jgi:hypothetical protein
MIHAKARAPVMRVLASVRCWAASSHAASVASRIAAAVFGGYALAHAFPVALVAAWPLVRADAALIALQASFLVYVAAVLWAFAARSALRAWLGLALATVLTGLTAWGLLKW